MIRLGILPLACLTAWAIRTLRTPWCQLLDHDVIRDIDGLMCRRCGHIINTMRIRLEDIRLGPNVPAGMNYLLVGALAYQLRTSQDDHDPVTLRRHGDHWQIVDGRHRVTAAMIAGRPDILARPEN